MRPRKAEDFVCRGILQSFKAKVEVPVGVVDLLRVLAIAHGLLPQRFEKCMHVTRTLPNGALNLF
jgi:hypothetical protein